MKTCSIISTESAKRLLVVLAILVVNLNGFGQNNQRPLPKPERKGGMPLMEALDKRCSTREFAEKDLPEQTLSNLLWAAWGINREQENKHTAPSSNNKQEIDVYVVKADGAYKYIPQGHQLEKLLEEDIRSSCGGQPFVATAPLNLIYIADLARTDQKDYSLEPTASYTNAGFIAQNVYLFCASEGLGAVARGWINQDELKAKLHLRAEQKIILGQTVGFPMK
jgi:SagB-type dehydrogenase family enzyme